MTTPEDSSNSSFPPEIQKTKPTPSSISISKFVDDIAVGNVTAASAGAISCSAPSLRPSYLQALLGDHHPNSLLGSFSSVKDEDFPELISTAIKAFPVRTHSVFPTVEASSVSNWSF